MNKRAITWEQWISSDKGQKCAKTAKLFRSHNPERHLENNMRAAFYAGFTAALTQTQVPK